MLLWKHGTLNPLIPGLANLPYPQRPDFEVVRTSAPVPTTSSMEGARGLKWRQSRSPRVWWPLQQMHGNIEPILCFGLGLVRPHAGSLLAENGHYGEPALTCNATGCSYRPSCACPLSVFVGIATSRR
eukprot:s799_g3.t2